MKQLSPVKPANLTKAQAEKLAETVATRLNLRPESDLAEIIVKRLGGRVEIDDEFRHGAIEVDGPKDFCVRLPSFLTEGDRRFTLAHELGHLVMHARFGEIKIAVGHGGLDAGETEANWFALALLMPRKAFRQLWRRHRSPARVAEHFRVPLRMVDARMHMLEPDHA